MVSSHTLGQASDQVLDQASEQTSQSPSAPSSFKRWQAGTALIIALGTPIVNLAPIATLGVQAQSTPVRVAQTYNQPVLFSRTLRIPVGTVIPVTYDKAEKIVVTPDETQKIDLTVPSNIRASNGTLLIPAGSKVEGELRPATTSDNEKGSRFIAKTLVLKDGSKDGLRMPLDATSNIVTRKETIEKGNQTASILTGAAIGTGAATIISGVTGNRKITLGKILIGTAGGALGGLLLGKPKKTEVVVINSDSDLDLRLNSPLAFNRY
ncbi:hypothetical protein [Alkalinema sp. FACHB-956]|uniref:hypothetical protein n=1 Tax=Alkalinema sp. FACHB-956 TaxID=2692768 RepID=UPI001F555693|nr:hypothetical protein [Alkalinema sp. FACHB-956]